MVQKKECDQSCFREWFFYGFELYKVRVSYTEEILLKIYTYAYMQYTHTYTFI